MEIGGVAVLEHAPPAIDFAADGSVSGTTGLNRFNGRYEIVDVSCDAATCQRPADATLLIH